MANTAERFAFATFDVLQSERIAGPRYSYWKSVFQTFFKRKTAIFWLALLLSLTLMSFVQPLVSGYDPAVTPNINNPSTWYQKPSSEHWFGTDDTGNDLWDVVWSGTRMSLSIAFIAASINIGLGILVGAVWGYSKRLDPILLALYNIISNVPSILRSMMLMYIFGRGFWQMVLAMTITGWLGIAFFIRTQVMIIRDREYNLASRCLGTPLKRMITRNILPYMVSVIATLVYQEIPGLINTETVLSYLGIGLPSTYPSLGRMIDVYWSFVDTYPHMIVFPGIVMGLVTISFYVVGQLFADASDPRTHR
ncbi:MAG TPA: ABC transporter permease [Rectinemataceae bacterium]|nr:ABC transporter permease [Rectinemataceae bacterium]